MEQQGKFSISISGAFFWGIVIGTSIMCFLATTFETYTMPYKQGQIDALTGKINYQLVRQSDSTLEWQKK